MRVWFDTEFLEDGKTIDLISIGLVREDGNTLYMESSEFDEARVRADPWLNQHVVPHLKNKECRISRNRIANNIIEFVAPAVDRKEPVEFWAYFAAYDWVALCQLYGRMIDLPDGFPMFCRDFKQDIEAAKEELRTGCWKLRKQRKGNHNALEDALWLRKEHLRFELGVDRR
jgi:hypothetical protein